MLVLETSLILEQTVDLIPWLELETCLVIILVKRDVDSASSLNKLYDAMKLYKDRVNRDVLEYSFANRLIEQWNRLS